MKLVTKVEIFKKLVTEEVLVGSSSFSERYMRSFHTKYLICPKLPICSCEDFFDFANYYGS
jgi:hypothetical protein